MTWKSVATAALVVVSANVFAVRASADVKIGVVDLQRALNETEDGRKAKARLKKLFQRRQEMLNGKQNKLKELKEAIERQRSVLSREALQERVEDYQKLFVELQSTYVEYQRELAAKESELTERILERMQSILRRIGQSRGYTLIIERNESGVVWVPTNLDLTDQVIQRYNSGEGKDDG